MSRIATYLQVSLDGYYAGPDGGIDWAKSVSPTPSSRPTRSSTRRVVPPCCSVAPPTR